MSDISMPLCQHGVIEYSCRECCPEPTPDELYAEAWDRDARADELHAEDWGREARAEEAAMRLTSRGSDEPAAARG